MNTEKNLKAQLQSSLMEAAFENHHTLHLTANENLISKTSQSAMTSSLSNRYLLNHHLSHSKAHFNEKDNFIFKNFPSLTTIFKATDEAAKKLFQAEHIELRTLSGLHATTITIATCTKPGDTIWCLPPDFGGHFATAQLIESLGRNCEFLPWDKTRKNIDLTKIQSATKQPNMILFDYADPIHPLPIKFIRDHFPQTILV